MDGQGGGGSLAAGFEFATATRIVFGRGRLAALPDLLRQIRSSASPPPLLSTKHAIESSDAPSVNSSTYTDASSSATSSLASSSSSSSSSASSTFTTPSTIFIVTGADQSRARPLTDILDREG